MITLGTSFGGFLWWNLVSLCVPVSKFRASVTPSISKTDTPLARGRESGENYQCAEEAYNGFVEMIVKLSRVLRADC